VARYLILRVNYRHLLYAERIVLPVLIGSFLTHEQLQLSTITYASCQCSNNRCSLQSLSFIYKQRKSLSKLNFKPTSKRKFGLFSSSLNCMMPVSSLLC